MEKLPKDIEAGLPIDLAIMTKSQMMLTLKSNVQQRVSDNCIQILMPIYNGKLLPLEKDLRLVVVYTIREVGRFEFEAIITDRSVENNIHLLALTQVTDVKKSQRRNYYRVPFFETIKISRMNKPLPDEVVEKLIKEFEAQNEKYKHNKDIIVVDPPDIYHSSKIECRDISGGGLRGFSKEPLELFELVRGELHLEDFHVEFVGEVIRVSASFDSVFPYEIGVRFTEMDENSRTRLIGYIFKKQRNLMKKG